jgi:hypothetical protein
MTWRDTVLTRLDAGSHWQLLVPMARRHVVAFLVHTCEALDRPGEVEVRTLHLGEVDASGRARPAATLILLAIPHTVLTHDELTQALTNCCGGDPPPGGLPAHGFIVPLGYEDLWPVGEAIKVFEAWLQGSPGSWEEALDEEEEDW